MYFKIRKLLNNQFSLGPIYIAHKSNPWRYFETPNSQMNAGNAYVIALTLNIDDKLIGSIFSNKYV